MFAICLIVLVFGQSLAANHPWEPKPSDASWMNWPKKHQELVQLTLSHGKDEKIVFIGDSITDFWASIGKSVWDKYYAPLHAYNYGISGDRTEHVLYRLENKEFDKLSPKVSVLMIGTNNLHDNTVDDIARGVQEVVKQTLVKMPLTKVILLGVLPRSEPEGSKAKQLNKLIAKFGDNKKVFYLDMWSAFESPDGKQKTELYIPDRLHLNAAGYEVWAKTMDPLLKKLNQ